MSATKMGDSHLTIEWLQQTLEKSTKSKSKLLKWELKEIGVGQGYLSQMVRVSLVWETPEKLPSDVVLKIPKSQNIAGLVGNEETTEAMSSFLKIGHSIEATAYQFLAQYENMPTPTIYSADLFKSDQDPGVIVMEYLNEGILVNMVTGYNLQQVLSMADGLARMHAKSLENRDWVDKIDVQGVRKMFEGLMSGALSDAEKNYKDFPDFFEKYVKPITQNLDLQALLDMEFDAEKKLGMTSVLAHGDFWANNLMFRKDKNGCPSNELLAFLDFQLAHPGNCTHDLAELLVLSCDTELRRSHTNTVLDYYFARLTEYTQGKVPFGLEQVLKAYKSLGHCYAVFCALMSHMLQRMPELGRAFEGDKDKNFDRMLDRAAKAADDLLADLLINYK